MSRNLSTKHVLPASGMIRRAVVFLHGYGADGADLLSLGDVMAPHLPDTLFLSPDAPEACVVNPMGRQWFSIPWIDGSDPEGSRDGMMRAQDDLANFLRETLAKYELGAQALALVGFSQGTMMALHLAPRWPAPMAGVVGFSGRLLEPDALADEVTSRPPVILIHGDQDEVVPPQALPDAADALAQAGFEAVYAHVMRGTGHGISPDGLEVATAFLRQVFGLDR